MSQRICAVAVDVAHFGLDKLYDYFISDALLQQVQVGSRVLVPFGKGNRSMEGVVLALRARTLDEPFQIKPVSMALDEQPVLDEEQIQIALWMREHLYCSFYTCLRQMLPSGLWFQQKETYQLLPITQMPTLCQTKMDIIACFTDEKPVRSIEELKKLTNGRCTGTILRELVEQGVLEKQQTIRRRTLDKTERMYTLAMEPQMTQKYAHRARQAVQMDVISLLADGASMTHKELAYMTGASDATLYGMAKRGVLQVHKVEVMRIPSIDEVEPLQMTALNQEQQTAYDGIMALSVQESANAALLFGVTGSGKTQVYLHLISDMLKQGKGSILMVPEIGLTSQFVRLFMGHFGEKVAILHSALSAGERYDGWKRIRAGTAKVVIGTRSAVFAPVQKLGLIILDEEQDGAYKSDQSPRYHARDIAKYRVAREKCLLVLGSATPSIETYHSAMQGKISLFTLKERYHGTKLPQVVMADRKGDVKQGYGGMIGSHLFKALQETLERGEQAILFLNRRGSSRAIGCSICGWIPTCEGCSAPMTYHAANERIMCHYCGSSFRFDGYCPDCGSGHISSETVGTQHVEKELHAIFPQAKVLRMDADSTMAKNAHTKLLNTFAKGRADILLGTQMVAKGLDFERVSLVGVLDADQMLFAQDFRARERTFSLITQVVGRAGRRQTVGNAMIQTYHPEHTVLLQAARQDYEAFYMDEINQREALRCPPIDQLLFLNAAGEIEQRVMESLVRLRQRLLWLMDGQFSDFRHPILGPTPATVVRVAGKYRYYLIIRCPDNKRRRQLIAGVMCEFLSDQRNKGISLIADQNPDII